MKEKRCDGKFIYSLEVFLASVAHFSEKMLDGLWEEGDESK
jgi:hypothetical protein